METLSLTNPNNTVAVIGDWHTDIDWMLKTVERINCHEVKNLLHVGDFGYGLYESPAAEEVAMAKLSTLLEGFGMTLLITLGNHDNWVRFNALTPDDDGAYTVWPNIRFLPRGYRFTVDGISFVSLGGAASINYQDLTEGVDWWREEVVTMGDLYRLGNETASVMIAHDAPEETQALFSAETKLTDSWPVEAYQYSNLSQRALSAAVAQVKPEIFFHGHYHADYVSMETVEGHSYTSVGLNMNGRVNNVALLNTATLETVWV